MIANPQAVAAVAAIAHDPLADQALYRRLVITSTDNGANQWATFAKLAATEQVLRLVEAGTPVPASRHDAASRLGAIEAQQAYLSSAKRLNRDEASLWAPALEAWQESLEATDAPEANAEPPAPVSQEQMDAIDRAELDRSPTTTRAALRHRFIKAAKQNRHSYTVDWTHLRLAAHDRNVRINDPLAAEDPIAEELIELATETS